MHLASILANELRLVGSLLCLTRTPVDPDVCENAPGFGAHECICHRCAYGVLTPNHQLSDEGEDASCGGRSPQCGTDVHHAEAR